ncbi:MAG: S-layer homology domain-containing protein [Oscillospiraceae bacterium]|nr:S-layer homology domain-containing protein [Oscillospiraceae bacterium]
MADKRFRTAARVFSAILVLLFVLSAAPVPARAAVNDEGLLVETLNFRDVLRLYTLDKGSFGADAMQTDAAGVTNAARRLAELFTYTVGLNYSGSGLNSEYYGKDITYQMGQDPYTDANLLATYNVEIAPIYGTANPLPQGHTTALRVYLTGYASAANGVLPILHYVWQSGWAWYAVKDDNPYYRVSYNGCSARQLAGTGYALCQNRASAGGTDTLQGWTDLTSAGDGDGVVQLDSGTLVVGKGTANIFGLTDNYPRVQQEGNYSSALLAVSDFVQGDSTYQTGPLVSSRSVYELKSMRRIPDGELLQEGVSYRFKVVYDEALAVTAGADWNDVGLYVRSETTGRTKPVGDFVWYGGAEYLSTDKYNPHTMEFTFTPSDEGYSVCTFVPVNLTGSDSRLKSADFHTRTRTNTPAPAAVTPTATLAVLFNANENAPLTRGVLAETLWILAGQPAADTGAVFSDQGSDPNMAQAMRWAASTAVMDSANGYFGANEAVNRGQAAVTLYRYAAIRGKDVSIHSDLSAWIDGGSVFGETASAFIWTLERGLVTGFADGTLRPTQPVLCGEAIVMIRTLQQNY